MNMKNIHLIEQFMKENGLEYDVPFTVEVGFEEHGKIIREIILCKKDDDIEIKGTGRGISIYTIMFCDCLKIIKKPWKPKYDDIYWYASIDGRVYSATWTDHNNDIHRYVLGNCFKTKEEAQKHKCDVFGILDGEPLIKWEK